MPNSVFTAYVSCLEGTEINVFRGDATEGTLNHIQTLPLSGKGLPLAASPDGKRLYASVIGEKDGAEEDHIDSFEIDADSGALIPLSSTIIMARMAHISVDKTGGWLLGASFPSSLMAVYPIGKGGHVQDYPSFSMVTPYRAHQLMTDYSNRFAFLPCLGQIR